jgi:Putative DNA-binding domain
MSLMPNQSQPLDTILSGLAAQARAWVRLDAARYEDLWEVDVCDIITGAAPASWQAERWVYPDGIFAATRTTGSTVVRWLKRGSVRLSGRTLAFPSLNANPQVQREASNAQSFSFEPSLWPTVRSDLIGSIPTHRQQPQHILVGEDMPTFQNFATAARYFVRDAPSIDSVLQRRLSYRHLDTTARIALVEYTEEDVWVSLEGDHLAGITIELMGASPGPTKKLRRSPRRRVHMKLQNGLPRNAFVVLVTGDRCLDQKTLGWEYPVMQDPDVRRLVKFDPSARLQALLYHKENDQVEFKLGVIGDSDSDKETVMKTVTAFANGDGGALYFGINKRYEALGLREADVPTFQDTVSDLIDDWVHPSPDWSFDILTVPSKHSRVVVELIVSPGDWPPYGVGTTHRSLRYYVRRHDLFLLDRMRCALSLDRDHRASRRAQS